MGQLRNCTDVKFKISITIITPQRFCCTGGKWYVLRVRHICCNPSVPATQEPCTSAESVVTAKSLPVNSLSIRYFGGQEEECDVRVGTLGPQFPTFSKPVKGQEFHGNYFTQSILFKNPGVDMALLALQTSISGPGDSPPPAPWARACPQLPLHPPASPAAQHALRCVGS